MTITSPAGLGLPEKSWPKENHRPEKWQDWETAPWPLEDDLAYKEMSNTGLFPAKPPANWKRLPTSEKLYPGNPFPAPKRGFTGYHKNDYQRSIRDHAVDEATGKKGEPLLATGGFADRHWKMRCYEMNNKIHAQCVIAQNQGRIWTKAQTASLQRKLSEVAGAAADLFNQKAGGSETDRSMGIQPGSPRDTTRQAGSGPCASSPPRSESPTIPDGMVEYIPAGDESQMRIQEPGNYRSRGTQTTPANSGYTTEEDDDDDTDDDETISLPHSTGSDARSRTQSEDRGRSGQREEGQGPRGRSQSADN